MSSVVSRWSRRLWNAGRDSLLLARALGRQTLLSRTPAKDVLLDEARANRNVVALSFLRLDRQIGLVRYHGLSRYLTNNVLPTSLRQSVSTEAESLSRSGESAADQPSATAPPALSGETDTGTSANSSTSTSQKARIAFMITAAMRTELQQVLQYDTRDIKSMTPLEASLILHHRVQPHQRSLLVPQLLQQHEQQQEKERRQAEAQAQDHSQANDTTVVPSSAESANEQETESSQPASTAPAVSSSSSFSQPAPPSANGRVGIEDSQPTLLISGASSTTPSSNHDPHSHNSTNKEPSGDANVSASVPDTASTTMSMSSTSAATGSSSFSGEWFEVVEISPHGTESHRNVTRIGLYSNRDEAELGCETRQLIADRDESKSRYEVRPVAGSEL